MRKNQAVDIIVRAAKIYDEQLNGKNLMIIFGSASKPSLFHIPLYGHAPQRR